MSRGRPVTVRRNDRTERTRVGSVGRRVREEENERSKGGHRPAGRFISESYGARVRGFLVQREFDVRDVSLTVRV